MRTLTLFDEVEIVMREREWLPWYEQYGPDFRDHMFHYPLEQRVPLPPPPPPRPTPNQIPMSDYIRGT